ncbi:MAG TPA: MFS transporter [Rhodospirillales bacterium]|nr:MFS transporter [Rhodospirillales bacterium]
MAATPPMRRSTLLLYALPALALAMPTIPLYVYLPTFYADGLGVGLAATGAALLIARVFDVITDPLIGVGSDRLRLPGGRRKPWIAAGAVIAAIALLRLFDPPAGVDAVYLGIWAVVLFTGWTLVAVPYAAWGAELSADYHERARITGARESAMILGVLAAGSAPAVAVLLGANEAAGIAAVAWLAIGLGLPTIVLLLRQVPEAPRPAKGSEPAVTLAGSWRALAQNRPFVRLLTGWFVNGLANGLPSVLFPLYLEYALEAGPVARGVLIMVYFLAGIIAIPLWVWLSRRHGKHRVWCWAMLLACAAFVWVPFLQPGDIALFFVVCVVTGFALGADLALPPAMQADVVDFDTLRTGQRRAGLFFALWSMSTKLALAAAVGIAFPALEGFGFEPAPGNAPMAIAALSVIYAGVPTVLKLVAVVVIWNHPITERRQQVIRRRLDILANRASKGPST